MCSVISVVIKYLLTTEITEHTEGVYAFHKALIISMYALSNLFNQKTLPAYRGGLKLGYNRNNMICIIAKANLLRFKNCVPSLVLQLENVILTSESCFYLNHFLRPTSQIFTSEHCCRHYRGSNFLSWPTPGFRLGLYAATAIAVY